MKRGIDISYCQGSPDFAKVRGAVDFVIMQIGYGRYAGQIDKTFARNYSECKKHGIPCGGYWFSYATTADEARAEAKCCIAAIKGKQFEYPIYFDVEGKSLVGKTGVSAMCKAFCEELEKAGYFAGIYMSRSPAQTMLTAEVAKRYALWLAEYGGRLNWSGEVGIWQYTDGGAVAGIGSAVDCNYCYVDYPAKIKSAGLNGFTAPKALKTLDSEGFKRGDKGVGVYAYKQLLRLACAALGVAESLADDGGFGGGTEKATNAVLGKLGYKQNGVAGKKLMKKLAKAVKEMM